MVWQWRTSQLSSKGDSPGMMETVTSQISGGQSLLMPGVCVGGTAICADTARVYLWLPLLPDKCVDSGYGMERSMAIKSAHVQSMIWSKNIDTCKNWNHTICFLGSHAI